MGNLKLAIDARNAKHPYIGYPPDLRQTSESRSSQGGFRLLREADKLAAKLDGLDQKAPESFARAHQVIEQHSADIDAMDGELRQLSNLPLE